MRAGAALLLASIPPGSISARASSTATDMPLSQFARRIWTTEDGLPQNSVNAIAQTSDGHLWIGTFGGLARFDGVGFQIFDPASDPALAGGRVLSLLADPDGSLWIGTESDGLLHFDRDRFDRVRTDPPLPLRIWSVARATDGTLWVGTDGGVWAVRGRKARLFGESDGLPSPWARRLALARNGSLWVATDRGTAVLEAGAFHARGTAKSVWALAISADGGVAAITESGEAIALAGNPPLPAHDDLGVIAPKTALYTRDGALWIGGLGVARSAEGRIRISPPEAGVVEGQVRASLEDREGNVWLGLDGRGLLRMRAGRVVTYGRAEGLGVDSVLPILETRDGSIWIGGNCGGLWRLRKDDIRSRPGADRKPLGCVFALAESRDGALWVAHDRGLDRFGTDDSSRRFGLESGLPSLAVHAIAEDRDGRLWVVTDEGLAVATGDRFEPATPAPVGALPAPQSLLFSRDGAIWVGYQGGVATFSNGTWKRLDAGAGIPSVPVRDLLEGADGAIWAATYGGGLLRIVPGGVQRIAAKEGLTDHFLSRLIDDRTGDLWITGNRGVYRVGWDDLEAVVAGQRAAVSPFVLGADEGLRGFECNGGGQPAGWRGHDGRLWLPTVRGVAVVDPRALERSPDAPPVRVDTVRIDGRPAPPDDPILAPPGTTQLEFRFTAVSLVAPESVRFRYRLNGHDRDWIDAGGSRAAIYSRLPPGAYSFEVEAANGQGVYAAIPTRIGVKVQPRLVQTLWFRTLLVVLPLLLLALAWRLRSARLRAAQEDLARLVEARTSELAAEKRTTEEQFRILALQDAELASLNRELEQRVTVQTAQIRVARDVAVLTLARLAELRDGSTGRHLDRIALLSRRLAEEIAVSGEDTLGLEFVDHLYHSAPLHDIGKVAIPDSILLKPGPLENDERIIMESHTTIGGDTLRDVIERFESHSFLSMGMEIAYHHHERWDGLGYPKGLSGEAIPLAARIVAVVDVYDALTSERSYKPALSHDEAIRRIALERGHHFEPRLVDAFVRIAHEIETLRDPIDPAGA